MYLLILESRAIEVNIDDILKRINGDVFEVEIIYTDWRKGVDSFEIRKKHLKKFIEEYGINMFYCNKIGNIIKMIKFKDMKIELEVFINEKKWK